MTGNRIDQAWIDNFRKQLARQGAVDCFEQHTESDIIAMKANRYPIGIPGMGLYKRGDHLYCLHLEGTEDYRGWDDARWSEELRRHDPRIEFVGKHTHYGRHGGEDGFWYQHLLVRFRVVLGNEVLPPESRQK